MKRLNADEVEELLEGQPLAKAQEELHAQAEEERKQECEAEEKAKAEAADQKSTTPPGTPPSLNATAPPDCNGEMKEVAMRTPTPNTESPQHHTHRAILHNNDNELECIQRILEDVHSSFFSAYDARSCATASSKHKSKSKSKSKAVEVDGSDVSVVIPRRMRRTFEAKGVGISVVSVKWFSVSVARWEKVDEKAHPVVEESRDKDRRSDAPKPSEKCSSASRL